MGLHSRRTLYYCNFYKTSTVNQISSSGLLRLKGDLVDKIHATKFRHADLHVGTDLDSMKVVFGHYILLCLMRMKDNLHDATTWNMVHDHNTRQKNSALATWLELQRVYNVGSTFLDPSARRSKDAEPFSL